MMDISRCGKRQDRVSGQSAWQPAVTNVNTIPDRSYDSSCMVKKTTLFYLLGEFVLSKFNVALHDNIR